MTAKIAILPGDGIGPEIVSEAVKVLDRLVGEGLEVELGELGGVIEAVSQRIALGGVLMQDLEVQDAAQVRSAA